MKIVIVTSIFPKDKRGLGVVVLNHAKAFQEKGFDVTVFCRGDKIGSEVFEGVRFNTFKYEQKSNSILNYMSTSRNAKIAWKHFYDQDPPNVVHGHDFLIYKVILKNIKSDTLKVFTVHDPLVYHQNMMNVTNIGFLKNLFFTWIEKSVYLYSDKIHYISKYTYNRFVINDNRIASKSTLVENWIDFDKFILPEGKNKIRGIMDVKDEFVIFTLRALERRMGLDRLIMAFDKFEKEIGVKSKLIIGGKGPMMAELKDLRDSLQLDNVELMGYISDEDAVKWYQLSDVVVIPSIDGEGFGLPIIEAMACGTPVLGTPNCAIPEVLAEKQERLFDGDSAEEIYEGLISFYRKWTKNMLPQPQEERDYVFKRFNKNNITYKIINSYIK